MWVPILLKPSFYWRPSCVSGEKIIWLIAFFLFALYIHFHSLSLSFIIFLINPSDDHMDLMGLSQQEAVCSLSVARTPPKHTTNSLSITAHSLERLCLKSPHQQQAGMITLFPNEGLVLLKLKPFHRPQSLWLITYTFLLVFSSCLILTWSNSGGSLRIITYSHGQRNRVDVWSGGK